MGTWGTAIFSDDETCDIKREYQTLLAFGVPREEALKKTIEYFNAGTELDDCRFWFAIASIQVKYNCLEKSVADITLELLNQGGDIDKWEEEDRGKRRRVLEKLKHQIVFYDTNSSPLKVPKPKIFKEKWKVGDIISYRLIGIKIAPFYNMYTGLQVVHKRFRPVSHIMPELASDEYMKIALFDYIEKEKPNMEMLLKRGYRPVHRWGNTYDVIRFSYYPYKGDSSKYAEAVANRKTARVLYDVDILGNQKDLSFPEEKLENEYPTLQDEIEHILFNDLRDSDQY